MTACATFAVRSDRTPCSALISPDWAQGVPDAADPPEHAPLPANATIADQLADAVQALKEWAGFGVAQTKNLHAANGRTADTIGLQTRCEARDAENERKAKRGIFGL